MPDDTTYSISYNFSEKDTVIAHFEFVPDPDSINVTFVVDPPGTGTITLNGTTIPTYPTTIKLDRVNAYSLLAQPIVVKHRFVDWSKWQASSLFSPDNVNTAVTYTYQDVDTVIARFAPFADPDSIYVTFDVYPKGKGTIALNGNLISSYPYKVMLDRKYFYELQARPIYDWKFTNWTKEQSSTTFSPSELTSGVTFKYADKDSLVAYFEKLPPPVDETIMIPNAFTPNGDGTNDVFRIIPGVDVHSVDFRIVNRFGEVVFETKDPKQGWDGNLRGLPAEVGTYMYQVKVKFQNPQGSKSEKMFKGDLTLVR
jgi:gliding motility-associated-like protein